MTVLDAALSLASQVFQYLNVKESRKYIDEMVELKRSIVEEEAKGYSSDDAKLEGLYADLAIIVEAARAELVSKQASQPPPIA